MNIVTIAAKMVADMMQAHFENPIESPYEFFPEDDFDALAENSKCSEEEVDQAVEFLRTISSMYSEDTLEFRQQVLEEVRKNLGL